MVLQWQAAAELMKKVESKGFTLVNKTKPNSPSHVRVAPAVCVFTGVFLVAWLIICARVCMTAFVCFYRFSCAFRTDVFQSICLKYQSHKSVVTMACLYMHSPHLLPVPKS